MSEVRTPLQRLWSALGRAWRTPRGKISAVFLLIGVWRPIALCIPALLYGIPALRALVRRLLYSVRAKLAAFYVFAGVLPILLVATVLLFTGYVALGQTSARIVESRLDRHVEWGEACAHNLELAYWRARSTGVGIPEAARMAMDASWSHAPSTLRGWARHQDALIATRGNAAPSDAFAPRWLHDRDFVGLTAIDSMHLDLRARVLVHDGADTVEFGCVLPIDTGWLNRALPGQHDVLRGGVGATGRSLFEFETQPDSAIVREGVVAFFNRGTVGNAGARLDLGDRTRRPALGDTSGNRLRFAMAPQRLAVTAGSDSAFVGYPDLAPWKLRSRWGLLKWLYVANPVDWDTGLTQGMGPPITVLFTVEGATRALLRFGAGGIENIIVIVVLVVVSLLVLVQIVATLQGFVYARAIANSVSTLDHGVRAIRAGDFDQRMQPREPDQLGALALAFNDMTARLQGLLEARVQHEAVERELTIARDVQARLFPATNPYTPFMEVFGVCMPARVVSGDSYDFIEVGGSWDAMVADVSGKGMSAALLMASMHSALRSSYLGLPRGDMPDPADILTRLNRHLHTYAEPSRFVTLFLVRYSGDGKLVYCNAGHNPAVLVREGRVEWLASGGLMLGPFPDLVYQSAVVDVHPGDVVCLYTDGLTEAESPTGEQFGEEQLARTMRGLSGQAPKDVVAALLDAVRTWRAGGEPGDDLTLVVLRITA